MDYFRILTKPGCPACDRAKTRLRARGLPFSEVRYDTPEMLEAFIEAGFRTFPQVFMGEVLVGGADDLDEYLNERDDY